MILYIPYSLLYTIPVYNNIDIKQLAFSVIFKQRGGNY